MFRAASPVAVFKNLFSRPCVCALADSERRSGFGADAPSGLLLPPENPSAAQPLPAHCARPAAPVPRGIPVKTQTNPAVFNKPDQEEGGSHGDDLYC